MTKLNRSHSYAHPPTPSTASSFTSSHTSSTTSSPNLSLLTPNGSLPNGSKPNKDQSAIFQHSPESPSLKKEHEAGCQPDEVYEKVLPKWRASLRGWLVRKLREENKWMADMQTKYRTPLLDRYFFWTALFGTHTFFMTVLPLFFFFGDHARGRGLLYVTGLGIYFSSYAKDLVCVPRPYSPPVVRLSMSTHGLEYGFPSSHSTNSISTALFLATWLTSWKVEGGGVEAWLWVGWGLLFIYASSVTFGRMYCGMHSTMDCLAGGIMGFLCWLTWELVGGPMDAWVETAHWSVPALVVPASLLLVHKHPEPVDDCPCFEDAIAILSVMQGSVLAHWTAAKLEIVGSVEPSGVGTLLGMEGWVGSAGNGFMNVAKMIVGIGFIFAWRLIAKKTLHFTLPSIFRLASAVSHLPLPTRRHYKAATEYNSIPSSERIRPVPSFIDLPSEATLASALPETASNLIRSRGRSLSAPGPRPPVVEERKLLEETKPKKLGKPEIHYDIAVLTKVIVYSGIGYAATFLIPLFFRHIDRHFMK